MRTLGDDYILSPQQITSCSTIADGCSGGWTWAAYRYVEGAGGIEQLAAALRGGVGGQGQARWEYNRLKDLRKAIAEDVLQPNLNHVRDDGCAPGSRQYNLVALGPP